MGVHFKENEEKITLGMVISGIVIIAILVTSLIVYLLNINSEKNNGEFANREELQTSDAKNSSDDDFKSVSTEIGKSVNEAKNEMETNSVNSSNTSATQKNENKTTTNTSKTNESAVSSSTSAKNETATESTSKNEVKSSATNETTTKSQETTEIKFIAPVKGEILREFAKDSLVYSNTLEEWITHTGVDVKADKTTVVKAASKGKVESIKNDPRYGLTVIVSHSDGYKTVYANLLTAEYVVEGEELEEGQTIGTVGNSSSFEFADEYHLHFELIKDGEYLNPCNFIDF